MHARFPLSVELKRQEKKDKNKVVSSREHRNGTVPSHNPPALTTTPPSLAARVVVQLLAQVVEAILDVRHVVVVLLGAAAAAAAVAVAVARLRRHRRLVRQLRVGLVLRPARGLVRVHVDGVEAGDAERRERGNGVGKDVAVVAVVAVVVVVVVLFVVFFMAMLLGHVVAGPWGRILSLALHGAVWFADEECRE